MPAAPRFAERVRVDPRPRRRWIPLRPGRHLGAGRAPLPARHQRPRDELGHADRLDDRSRRAPLRSVAARGRAIAHAAPATDRLRRQPHPAADGPLRERGDAAQLRVRARVRLWALRRDLGLHRGRLPPGPMRQRELGRRARADERHEHGLRGAARGGAHPHQGGRAALRGAGLERGGGAAKRRGRIQAAGLDRPPLAALARPRQLPRPPMALAPRALGPDPEGPHVCAERRARRGSDNVSPGNAWGRAQLGLPLQLDPRLDVRAVGPRHARIRLGGERLHPLHRGRRRARRGPPDHVRRRR